VGYILLGAFLLIYPWFASPFWTVQIGAQSFILGVIALSLTLLAGYGGMVSLAQLSVAGCAGYMVAIWGFNDAKMGMGWPWIPTVLMAVLIAVVFGTLIGAVSVRTEGIYTIMITLAISVGFYYFVRQNYPIFNGWSGFAGLKPPVIAGLNLRDPTPFYYLSLVIAAIAYSTTVYLGRSTFGLSLQGIRDNDRRMRALGFNVTAHRILAYTISALLASLHRAYHRYLDHRGCGRIGASHRRFCRGGAVHFAGKLRHRSDRPGAFQSIDRRRIPGDCAFFAGRYFRVVGKDKEGYHPALKLKTPREDSIGLVENP
jgi:branched-chain amino acid transport system permease protein